MLTNQPQIHLKLLLKEQFKKQQNELVIFFGNKTANRVTKKSPQNTSETVECKTKTAKESIYLQKKGKKLLKN